jgi:hypothetical protein
MESGSQSASSPERSSNRFADIIGTLIALLTLTIPLIVVGHYSNPAAFSQPASHESFTKR